MSRIVLSPPHITPEEFERVRDGFMSGAVAPAEQVPAFEREFASALARAAPTPFEFRVPDP
jgi:dTDP-4-amino-4,6-dideoxygalactose transaminase